MMVRFSAVLALLVARYWRHCLHCLLMTGFVAAFMVGVGAVPLSETARQAARQRAMLDPWDSYGVLLTTLLYCVRLLSLLCLPQVFCNICGLFLYNTFPDSVSVRGSPLLAPFVCVRVVTRGDFPRLVTENVRRNIETCTSAGLENFMIEVVTDRVISCLGRHARLRQLVVPPDYRPQSGALFKARALQYCLEPSVNVLQATDWVLHLDEETLLTAASVRGVINFTMAGRHQFGQGVVTYAADTVVNWLTTLADSFRVAEDYGKLRFTLNCLHRPLLSWKGSYVLTQLEAEQKVSYDNGPDGSVAEDCFFAMSAIQKGYSFGFVDGEMWERSPFTVVDLMRQRKRWLQGIWLVVRSGHIHVRTKFLLAMSLFSWLTMPLSSSGLLLGPLLPLNSPLLLDWLAALIGAVNLYLYAFGAVKSLGRRRGRSGPRLLAAVLGALAAAPLNLIVENAAVIAGVCGKKHQFYVVQKEIGANVLPSISEQEQSPSNSETDVMMV